MGKPPVYPKSESQNFLKKLYAFTNIKQLLNKIQVTSDEAEKAALEERAVSLALENNLVTDLTSLVVVKPDAEPVINQLATIDARERPVPLSSGHFSAGGFGVQTTSYNFGRPYSSFGGGLRGTRVSSGSILGVSSDGLGGTGISFSSSSFSNSFSSSNRRSN